MLRNNDNLQLPSSRYSTQPNELWMPPNPMAVLNLGHLMRHFGFLVAVLFLAQLWCAWRIGIFVAPHLHWTRYSCFGTGACLTMLLNAGVWFRCRGKLCMAFHLPGLVLYLLALLPVFALHIRDMLLHLK